MPHSPIQFFCFIIVVRMANTLFHKTFFSSKRGSVMNMMFNCCKYILFLLLLSFWMSYMFKINTLFILYFKTFWNSGEILKKN